MEASELIQRIQALRDKEAKSKVGLTEDEEDELGELQGQRHQQQLKEIPSPQCCESMREWPAVYMYLPWDEDHDRYGIENPEWRLVIPEHIPLKDRYADRPAPTYCPYCGKKLPKFVKRTDELPQPMMAHGPYYCETCGERNQDCTCHPHETIYELRNLR